jgi:hypothetical protein
MEKKDKKFNTAVVCIISWPGPQTFAFLRSGQFLQREITRPPNLTALGISLILSHHPLSTLEAERQVRDFLIGPRNKKQRKKRSTIKILHPPFQITSRGF